jgi:hypothetical protein
MKKILLGLFISLFLITQGYCADIARLHNFLDGEILTAALLNTEFDNIITQANDLEGDNLKSNIAITTSGTATFTGTFNAQGTSLNLGNGGSDVLTLNAAGGITYTPAATWTFTGAQTISGTWANLGTVTTADINGGTIDGVTIGASSAPTVTNLGSVTTCDINGGTINGTTVTVGAGELVASADIDIGTYELRANTFESDVATGTAPFTVASTTKVTNLNADNADTIDGIEGIYLMSRQIFTSSGTFTAPAGVTRVFISGCGNGGGGGGGYGGAGGGGAGGGAMIIHHLYAVTALSNYTVTINSAGVGGATNADGTDGGTVVFDTITINGGAKGIKGGSAGSGGAVYAPVKDAAGAVAGSATGGYYADGGDGATTGGVNGGGGGGSLGDGGVGGAGAGGAGINGGGGGGGVNGAGGGNGGAGFLIVEY